MLTQGGQNLKAVRARIAYLHRHGDLEVETDQGERLIGQDIECMLVEDWDLDVEATLRRWRADFAAQLRALGVAANATERAVRGSNSIHKKDPIFRAGQQGESIHLRQRAQEVEAELRTGSLRVEDGKMRMLETRRKVSWDWHGFIAASAVSFLQPYN